MICRSFSGSEFLTPRGFNAGAEPTAHTQRVEQAPADEPRGTGRGAAQGAGTGSDPARCWRLCSNRGQRPGGTTRLFVRRLQAIIDGVDAVIAEFQ